jgi:aspartate racemase
MIGMKTIGLIGGLSWYSTLEYYRTINQLVQQELGGHASAQISLQSLNFAEIRALQESSDWSTSGKVMADTARRCQDSGADFVLICSNLMHKNADDVAAALDVPLLHIADAIAERAAAVGWTRVGLLGTRQVMEETFYTERLQSSRTAFLKVIAQLAERGAQAVVLGCTEIELLVKPEDSAVPPIDSMRTHAEAAVREALR